MSQESIQHLANNTDYIPVTMDLYDGRLVQFEGQLYFIAERFGGWEVIEQASLADVERIESVENFMGVVTEIRGRGVRWQCKNLPEGTDLNAWLFHASTETSMEAEPTSVESVSVPEESIEEQKAFQTMSSDIPEAESPPEVLSASSEVVSNEINQDLDPYLEHREDMERLRAMLNNAPQVLRHLRRINGADFDPNDDATLAEIVRSQPQLVQQLEKLGGVLSIMGMVHGTSSESSDSDEPKQGLQKWLSFDGLSPFAKIFKGIVIVWVGMFVLQFAFGILVALVMVLSSLF